VTVIDHSLAQKYFPGQNPIGKRIRIDPDDTGEARMFEIIGVVARMKLRGFDQISSLPIVYFAQPQVERTTYVLLVRTSANSAALEPSIRAAVAAVDPTQPVYDARPMLERVQETWAAPRFLSFLLLVFAGLALVLSTVGLYGVLSYSALRRLREIGIRLALGAQRADILRLVLGEGVRLLGLGLALGLAGVFAAAQVLRSFLFEVSPLDPSVSLGVSVLLIAAALTAAWWPARRAARIDPIITLRAE
jgi:putative ABC transport system permease protein